MMTTIKKSNYISFFAAIAISIYTTNTLAAVSSSQYAHTPPAITNGSNTKPLVMLVMGNDHQLFYKAYNDWSDLDNDGVIESSYKHSFDYYGYFDSYKCYDYDSGDGRFEPEAITTDKYCTGSNSSRWSGNFLNWATMTRIDVMRKVLYGGKRFTDTASRTVLERAFLPTDAHSFAKYYTGSDINDLTPYANSVTEVTMCNTTYDGSSVESQNTSNPPLLRAVEGDYRYWAANERWQCTWDDEHGSSTNGFTNDPVKATVGLTADGGPDYIVRVEACSSAALVGKENCKEYPDGNLKPVGLLHNYGETDQMEFGLLTGSYKKNKSGGVVRKDISSFAAEVNVATDGTFTGAAGIVKTIDLFRITKYNYADGLYNTTDTCPYGKSEFAEGNCSNWGNPATEMYLEAVRYFAGLNKTGSFSNNANDDTTYIAGLTNVGNWNDPLDTNNFCASCNIIILNTSDFSYDSDSLSMTGLSGTPNLNTFTDNIGVKEKLTVAGSEWFVGENGTNSNQLCTAKTIGNLSDAKGNCPNSPRLEGSYKMSGIAHYAHTNDIRSLTGNQKIQTYAVAMSPAVPKLKIPVHDASGAAIAGKFIEVIPACRDTDTTDLSSTALDGNCAIVDFKITTAHAVTNVAGTWTGRGKVTINWEDTEQGGDYDQDMLGTLTYVITPTQITISSDVEIQSTPYKLGFGYIISGTTNDGFRVHSGINAFTYSDPNSLTDCSAGCSDSGAGGATNITYTIGTSTGKYMEDPLWYAAKWGGFTDIDNDGEPSDILEYDSVINATGASGSDGIPDNYFLSQNPGQVEEQLNNVFFQISNRRAAGTAAAVITNTVTSTSLVVQGLYQPEIKSFDQLQTMKWGGFLHTFILDKDLNLREDGDQDGQLDDTSTDKIISFYFDSAFNRTRVARYTVKGGPIHSIVEIDDVKTLWNAKDELNEMNSAVLDTQRSYTTPNNLTTNPNSQRYIFTNLNGTQTDFVASNFTSANYGYFHLQSDKDGVAGIDENDAKRLVNFTRGVDYSNLRSRTIDYDNDNTDEVWRLGDIIHSTPIIVDQPTGIWKDQYGDTTFDEFKQQYKTRRNMVYVGANDGLLHAFNGGFFDSVNKKYNVTRTLETAYESVAPASHKLGAEVWAFAPKNLLPHLQWLSEPNYPNHVYYVDGDIKSFDVNIFADDATHPNGWGTILVANMRFGGGSNDSVNSTAIDVDIDNDSNTDFTARSSIIVLDITNPEAPPTLLYEYNNANLGLTLSTPELLAFRRPDVNGNWAIPSINKWHLVFGSGPTDLTTLLSTQSPSLYIMDLATGSVVTKNDAAILNSYVSKIHTVDWTNNFTFDNVYFGIAGGTVASPTGFLARMGTSQLEDTAGYYDIDTNWNVSVVINPTQPFLFKPTTLKSEGKNWVFAGSGRRLITPDDSMTPVQGFYGIKENIDATNSLPDTSTFTKGALPLTTNELQNVTGIRVFTNYTITDPLSNLPTSPSAITTFSGLQAHIKTASGWYRDWSTVSSLQERVNADTLSFSEQLLITTFIPSTDPCRTSGSTRFYSLAHTTGTAHPDAGFGEDTTTTNGGSNAVQDFISYTGENFGSIVCVGSKCKIIVQGSGGDDDETCAPGEICDTCPPGAVCTTDLKIPPGTDGRQSWREIYFEEEF